MSKEDLKNDLSLQTRRELATELAIALGLSRAGSTQRDTKKYIYSDLQSEFRKHDLDKNAMLDNDEFDSMWHSISQRFEISTHSKLECAEIYFSYITAGNAHPDYISFKDMQRALADYVPRIDNAARGKQISDKDVRTEKVRKGWGKLRMVSNLQLSPRKGAAEPPEDPHAVPVPVAPASAEIACQTEGPAELPQKQFDTIGTQTDQNGRQFDELQAKYLRLQEKYDDLEEELKLKQRKLNQRTRELVAKRQELAGLRDEMVADANKTASAQAKGRIDDLVELNKSLNSANGDKERRIEELENEMRRLNSDRNHKGKQIEQLEKDNVTLNEKYNTVVPKMREKVKQKNLKLTHLLAKLALYEMLKRQRDKLKQRLAAKDEVIATRDVKIEDLEERLRKLRAAFRRNDSSAMIMEEEDKSDEEKAAEPVPHQPFPKFGPHGTRHPEAHKHKDRRLPRSELESELDYLREQNHNLFQTHQLRQGELLTLRGKLKHYEGGGSSTGWGTINAPPAAEHPQKNHEPWWNPHFKKQGYFTNRHPITQTTHDKTYD